MDDAELNQRLDRLEKLLTYVTGAIMRELHMMQEEETVYGVREITREEARYLMKQFLEALDHPNWWED